MSLPTFEDYKAQEQNEGRKSAKASWWKFSRKKVSPEERRRRKFEGDTRPYSEKNRGHFKTANFMSYFFQTVSISGAVYGAYRMFWDQSIMGGVMVAFALVILYQYEKLARWTSDKFWDEWVAGRYNLKFAFLNFGVIWVVGFALTLGGAYFFLNDSQPAPIGSISSTDPSYVQMQKQVADARSDVRSAEKRVSAFKKDPSNLCPSNGKMVVCYKLKKSLARMQGAIVTAEDRLTAATKQMASRYDGIRILDDRATSYQLSVVDSRFWVRMGLFTLCLALFEFCMHFRSYYELQLYYEDEYARKYGSTPKTRGKKAKKRKPKKPSPRPSKQAGVTNRPVIVNALPVIDSEGGVSDEKETVIKAIPDGYKFCALEGCTNLVTGRKKFCSESHRVTSYSRGRVAS